MTREIKLPNNRTLKIEQDTHGFDPREDDNLGTIVSWHSRYSLGEVNLNKNDYVSAKDATERNSSKDEIVLPLYIYDHSGITISTKPFSCPWDSGQFGFIKISKDKIREEYGLKRVSQNLIEKVKSYLEAEVETYDKYLRGESYTMEILDKNGETEDSCSGFLGYDPKENGIYEQLSQEDRDFITNNQKEAQVASL